MNQTLFDTARHVHRSAEISECGRYRWWLRRSWQMWGPRGELDPSRGVCCFVMLNPSTADALQDDPTIRRCMGFARAWGYDTLSVRNLFPWRATNPDELTARSLTELCGGRRGNMELLTGCTANMLVVAWGAGVPYSRDREGLKLFRETFPDMPLYCLGTTKRGHPRHPLYVKADTLPVLFKEESC